jgi:hypothetical protein
LAAGLAVAVLAVVFVAAEVNLDAGLTGLFSSPLGANLTLPDAPGLRRVEASRQNWKSS